ncbi:MAG TPA: ThuA domain-containing protein [Solirubrobacteraceae bacterium]
MNITVWNEHVHEREGGDAARVYPEGIHGTLAGVLAAAGDVRTATLAEPDHGLGADVLDRTDVLLWWGHTAHEEVADEVVARVVERVLGGMGLLVLHSGHHSKPFRRLMGTTCDLRWRHDERETVWTVAPGHPIAAGVPESFVIPEQEMYGEFFDVPPPEQLIFVSSFTGGEVFRSGCCWTRGRGRIFFFSPGHETNPVYHQREVQRVLVNAARWAAPSS